MTDQELHAAVEASRADWYARADALGVTPATTTDTQDWSDTDREADVA